MKKNRQPVAAWFEFFRMSPPLPDSISFFQIFMAVKKAEIYVK
jgi:hypothetical protein